VWTTEPVMQVYTAAHLGAGPVPDIGKQGLQHRPFAAVCLEPQSYPNAPNCPNFPLPRIAPGQPQRGETVYRFGLLTD
jgi:aldose 1-epimerase